MVVPPHIRADIKHHLDTYVGREPTALLFPAHRAAATCPKRSLRGAWRDGVENDWPPKMFGCTICGTSPGR